MISKKKVVISQILLFVFILVLTFLSTFLYFKAYAYVVPYSNISWIATDRVDAEGYTLLFGVPFMAVIFYIFFNLFSYVGFMRPFRDNKYYVFSSLIIFVTLSLLTSKLTNSFFNYLPPNIFTNPLIIFLLLNTIIFVIYIMIIMFVLAWVFKNLK
ncbi:hypothetical protein COU56_01590 [Candidatus Pacearchaeota archaeon CG10_big_fil_rev_8_21_14_0_10_31_9]|nr:MAG: hypothetical protein COU56_01590 [Candidatus Pacearchaeota archaeon CG10_big_fil_rev_8_21_14_0_10_31_9]PIZ83411.1 MAG: hypothetical protein COX97_01195 [Candidatus Pacearchaeota archaeon CG_4_10_14_0_2_um_filter_05_32_18]